MERKNLKAAAQAVTDKFFMGIEDQQENVSKAAQTAQEDRQEDRTGKSSTGKKGAEKAAKEEMKVFSFRGVVQDVEQWRLYASIRGVKVDEFGAAAMKEYIKRHPLSAEEKALFDKRIESKKS